MVLELRPAGEGFAVTLAGRRWEALRPVGLRLSDAVDEEAQWHAYDAITVGPDEASGSLAWEIGGARLELRDRWSVVGDRLELDRALRVTGAAPGLGIATGAAIGVPTGAPGADGWAGWLPFAPAAAYGDASPVGPEFIGSPAVRARGVRAILVREDRLSAPVFALVARAGGGIAVWDAHPDAATVSADGDDREGARIVDARIRVASLGAELAGHGLLVGGWLPAREGDVTYDAGALPLGQHRGWRERFLPLADGVVARLTLGFEGVAEDDWSGAVSAVWRGAWDRAAGARVAVRELAEETYLPATLGVLASQVRHAPDGRAGIGLESDPVSGRPVAGSQAAVMGFVGANTDAALALLLAGGDPQHADAGAAILDAFASLETAPPAGEGFDLATGEPCCYRELDGVPAVFLRALAEGLHAALLASERMPERGAAWRSWALRGGEWLLARQREDGSFPRAWAAGTGEVLEESGTATAHAVPFLVALVDAGVAGAAVAAVAAGEASWRRAERSGFAGATLDNPDVVDKEAAVFALEAYLELERLTGRRHWIARAESAARLAETWIQLWDPPMPSDAPDAALHWKRGRSAVGMQGITTGVTMTDGFLAVNAAAFVRLARATGDPHWAEVARLVFHGSKSMLATIDDPLDLAGPGWQQEHWNLGPNRGVGLNRHWLPWAAVAVIRGHQRLMALGDPLAAGIARGPSARDDR